MNRFMRWWFHDAEGRPVFQHYRYTREPTAEDSRQKGYGYRYIERIPDQTGPRGWLSWWAYDKPPDADRLVYQLPWVLANPEALLLVPEGERDCDVARALGYLATSHHGGAGKFTEAMAESLAGHRGPIWLIADNDVPGAACVVRRYDLLREVGIPAKRLRVCEVVPAHRGADLRDHIEAGFGLDDLQGADLDRLREVAKTPPIRLSPGTRKQIRDDYPDLDYVEEVGWVNRETDYLVFPEPGYAAFLESTELTAEEVDQIKNWRPQIVQSRTMPWRHSGPLWNRKPGRVFVSDWRAPATGSRRPSRRSWNPAR